MQKAVEIPFWLDNDLCLMDKESEVSKNLVKIFALPTAYHDVLALDHLVNKRWVFLFHHFQKIVVLSLRDLDRGVG